MGAVPGNLETDAGPPMAVPLGHFVVGLAFLLLGALLGVLLPFDVLPGRVDLAHVHLLLVGWVCLTIVGAMTQFVPVWSGTRLHSRRLAALQLPLVVVGLLGFVGALLADVRPLLPVFGVVLLGGFWTFAYNVGRTLLPVRPWDVTERHFAIALGFFVLVTALGVLLAIDHAVPVRLPVARSAVRSAHATLAVFGAILTTAFGALYQLATMFTQSDLHGVDHHLQRVEELGYPVGALGLATGRLLDHEPLARIGALLVLAGAAAVGVVLLRRLRETQVERTPMLDRYAVVGVAILLWAILASPHWLRDPTAPGTLFGSPALVHLLAFGVIGVLVVGTLYHVVPFIVWVDRYSDRLGLEAVPMIDDLYDDRLATVDLIAVVGGGGLLALAEAVSLSRAVFAFGGVLALVGFGTFAANVALVIREHASPSLLGVLLGRRVLRRGDSGEP